MIRGNRLFARDHRIHWKGTLSLHPMICVGLQTAHEREALIGQVRVAVDIGTAPIRNRSHPWRQALQPRSRQIDRQLLDETEERRRIAVVVDRWLLLDRHLEAAELSSAQHGDGQVDAARTHVQEAFLNRHSLRRHPTSAVRKRSAPAGERAILISPPPPFVRMGQHEGLGWPDAHAPRLSRGGGRAAHCRRQCPRSGNLQENVDEPRSAGESPGVPRALSLPQQLPGLEIRGKLGKSITN